MGKLPGFTFYPGDWLKDPELRRCTRESRSVWIDMICLMFECEERGVLSTGGRPWSLREVAGALSGDERTNLRRVGELLRNGVAKRRKDGAVFSKRLVRDDQERQQTKNRVASFRGKKPSNGTCNAPVTPKYVNEDVNEVGVAFVPVIKAKFTLEEFDSEARFFALCEVYPKPNKGVLGMQAYQRAIESQVSLTRPDRNEIADVIEQAAAAYKQAKRSTEKKYIPELIAWLDKGIWQQDPKIWEETQVTGNARQRAIADGIEKAFS